MRTAHKRNPTPSRAAFTLVELLVVIGIIVVLMGILLPVIGRVRKQAQAANTRNQIAQLSSLIQAYHGDFKAYPGPIPNTQLRGAGTNNITTPTGIDTQITMAENLYLGLMGGLEPGATAGTFAYDKSIAGLGPRWLGTTPKKLPPYGDNTDITKRDKLDEEGDFVDEAANCADSRIPEYLDRFPERMPILYLRARAGVVTAPGAAVVEATPASPATAQYDLTQVSPYTNPVGGPPPGYIGVGKDDDGVPRKNPDITDTSSSEYYHHGFRTADAPVATATTDPTSTGYAYPYNINAALRHPTIANTPKQKDGYILISAGIDRIYGTQDDITNFGQY